MSRSRMNDVEWVKPTAPERERLALAWKDGRPAQVSRDQAAALTAASLRFDPLVEAVARVGMVQPKQASMSVADEVELLLEVGAEIEHALLLQYLYAAYSLRTPDPNPAVSVKARQWQNAIANVAVQEMGHLLTVQNLLRLIKRQPHLDRASIHHEDRYPFPLKLEPLTHGSLAKYVAAESPLLDPAEFPAIHAELTKIFAEGKLAATIDQIQRVGVLYARIFWLFQPDDNPRPELWIDTSRIPVPLGRHLAASDFETDANLAGLLATKEEWRATTRGIKVQATVSRESALSAIAEITTQGEGLNHALPPGGSPGDPGDVSHFGQFLRIYRSFFAAFPASGAEQPARDVPSNPNTSPASSADAELEGGRITHPQTLKWAQLCNVRYRMLMANMAHALSLNKLDPVEGQDRTNLVAWTISDADNEMMGCIRPLAKRLTRLPRQAPGETDTGAEFAGAPFELSPDPLPGSQLGLWRRHRDLLEDAKQCIAALRSGTLEDPDAELLSDIESFDSKRQPIIEARIAALSLL